jgi:hypothetical protein
MKPFKLLTLCFFAASICSAQSIPAVKAKALDNSEITLPSSGSPKVLILVVGFSHKSGEFSQFWDKKIASDFRSDTRVDYFVLPMLQSAPSFVRPMILHGMRKDVPAAELPHYVPLYSKEDEWKQLVSFSAADDPYLIVAAPDGHVVWQTHGSYSDEIYAQLKKSVAGVMGK